MKTEEYLKTAIIIARADKSAEAVKELEMLLNTYMTATYGRGYQELHPINFENQELLHSHGETLIKQAYEIASSKFFCTQFESVGHQCTSQCDGCKLPCL